MRNLNDRRILRHLKAIFRLRPLTLRSVIGIPRHPGVRSCPSRLIVITRVILPGRQRKNFITRRVDLILNRRCLLSMRRRSVMSYFGPIQTHLRRDQNVVQRVKTSCLTCTLLSTVVSDCFPILRSCKSHVTSLRSSVMLGPGRRSLTDVCRVQHRLAILHHLV